MIIQQNHFPKLEIPILGPPGMDGGAGGLSCVGILLKTNTRGGLQKGPKVGNLRRFLSALVFVL